MGSSYYLGATGDKLGEITAHEGESLRPIHTVQAQDSLTQHTWRKHLTDKSYTVAFTRFFDRELEVAGDWKAVVADHLYSSKSPLANGLCGGREYFLRTSDLQG